MDIRFDGKRALVTGAGNGLGKAIAVKLLECGAKTVAVSLIQSELDALKAEYPAIETLTLDLSNWDNVEKEISALGHFDLLVNSAGVTRLAPLVDVKEADFDFVFNTNIKALLNVSRVVARSMVEKKTGGAIVHMSSAASLRALKDHAVYCASKGAVDSLTMVMALELGPHKIRTNCVNPTAVMTDMGRLAWSDPAKAKPLLDKIPLGRFGEVEDVVNAVLWLLSDRSSYVNGLALPLEGGMVVC